MPDLTYQPSVQPEGLPGRAIPRLPEAVPQGAFGGEIGRAFEGGSTIVQEQHDIATRQMRQNQLTDAHNQLQSLSLNLTHDPQSGAFTRQGKDAFGLTQQYLPKFDQQAGQIVASVPDPRAREAAQLAMQQVRDHLTEQLDTHELEQHRQFGINTAKASVALAQQTAAANYNHPDILAAQRDHLDASLENLGSQQGWSQEQIADAKQEAHSHLHTDVLERMLGDGQDKMASVYLKAHKDELDAGTYATLSAHIEAKNKEKQNELKQDIADRYQDSLEAAQYGIPNAIRVNRAEMNVLYPKDAQRRWDELQIYQQAGAQAKAYDHMSPTEIEADLKGRQPGEGPEAVYRIKAYNLLQEAARRSISQRTEDPAAFAQQRGNWQPLDWRNAQTALTQLQQRARTQPEVSEQTGVPVPLLSKPEAKQVAGMLNGVTPQNAAAMLAQLKQTLPDRAFGSVLDQIAPHSPVLAVAGSLTQTPTKGNAPSWYNARFGTDPQVAQGIIDGERILSGKGEEKVKGGFMLPPDEDTGSKSGLATTFRNAAGGTDNNLFQGRPQTAELYYDAFKAYYAHLAAQKGVMGGQVDQDIARQAAQSVLGNTVRFNHSDIAVPRGMDPSQFNTAARLGIATAARQAGMDEPIVRALQDSAGLAEISGSLGSGRYAVVDGNGRYVGKNGRTLVVDLNQITVPKEVSFKEHLKALTQAEIHGISMN